MLNSLKIATDGYLKQTTKIVLVIAVAGYLNFGDTITPTPKPVVSQTLSSLGNSVKKKIYVNDNYRQSAIDDSEIIEIVKITLKITTL